MIDQSILHWINYIYIYMLFIYTYSIYAAYNMAFCLVRVPNTTSLNFLGHLHPPEVLPRTSSMILKRSLVAQNSIWILTISAAMARNASQVSVNDFLGHLTWQTRLSSASLFGTVLFVTMISISWHFSWLLRFLPTFLVAFFGWIASHESPSIHGPAKLFTGQKASQLLVKSLAHAPFYLTPTSFVERAF